MESNCGDKASWEGLSFSHFSITMVAATHRLFLLPSAG